MATPDLAGSPEAERTPAGRGLRQSVVAETLKAKAIAGRKIALAALRALMGRGETVAQPGERGAVRYRRPGR